MSWNPTLNATETGRDVRAFVKQFTPVLWRIFKPLLPWIIACHVFDAVVTALFFAPDGEFALGAFLSAYFYTALVISWHRVVIDGPENAVPMNPLKPQRHEWAFIGVGIGLYLALILIAVLVGGVAALIHPAVGIILGLALLLAGLYAFIRIAIYFPAKAVNRSLTLKEAYPLTQGLVWKILWAPFVASWRLILGVAGYVFVAALVIGAIFGLAGSMIDIETMPVWIESALNFILTLPMIVYFEPLLYVLGVGCLSNYYLYAIRRGAESHA